MKLNTCYFKVGSLLICSLSLQLYLDAGERMQSWSLWIVVVFYLAECKAESNKSPTDDTKTLKAIKVMKALKADTKPPKQVKEIDSTKNKSDNAVDVTQIAAKGPVDIEFSAWDKELPNLPDLPSTTTSEAPGTESGAGLETNKKTKDTSKGNGTEEDASKKEAAEVGVTERIEEIKERVKEGASPGDQPKDLQTALCVTIVKTNNNWT